MAFNSHVGVIALVLTIFTISFTYGAKQPDQELLGRLLKDYDTQSRPLGTFGTTNGTVVTVNMYIRSISSMDDLKMEWKTQLTFRQQWKDQRLVYNQRELGRPYLSLMDSSKVWIPDLFFSNEKTGHIHNLLKPNEYVRIFPDGEVLYSTRVSLTLNCPMIMKLYPHDRQTCSIRMASYGYTTDDIIFKWKEFDPVQVTPELHLPRFALEQFTTDYCDSHTNTGIYSCLRVDIWFHREFAYYLIRIYIPCTALVIMAYLSFWLGKKEVVGRLVLILITYLMMFILIMSIDLTMGSTVSYTRAVDVWTGWCLTFLFFALVEFIVVNFLARREDRNVGEVKEGQGRGFREAMRNWSLADKLDVLSRVFYPIVFVLFVGIYYAAYNMKI